MSRPGVFVSESVLPTPVETTPPAIAAGAILAELPSGPITPTLVTSWYQFSRTFGPLNRSYPGSFAANQFFRSGGRDLYVCRVIRDDAATATADIVDNAGTAYLTFSAKSPGVYGNNLRVSVKQNINTLYDVQVFQEQGQANDLTDDLLLETWTNLNLGTHGDTEVLDIVNIQSQFVNVTWGEDDTVTIPVSIATLSLSGGTDGSSSGSSTLTDSLQALAQVDRSMVLFAPGNTDTTEVEAIISHAEQTSSFAVLDTPADLTPAAAVSYAAALATTSHAGVYYPHVWVADTTSASSNSIIKIAPSAAVAGIIMSTDASAGVFQTPAGLTASLPSVVAVERNLTNEDLDALNDATKPVNAVRILPGAGATVMGGRTLDQRSSTGYINVRRTIDYLSREMQSSLTFALFQNNTPDLWRQITAVLDNYLRGLYAEGGLRGDSIAQAFYIKVDGENNTASDIQAGVVNVEVGVALQYPAEFIKIKLTQRTVA